MAERNNILWRKVEVSLYAGEEAFRGSKQGFVIVAQRAALRRIVTSAVGVVLVLAGVSGWCPSYWLAGCLVLGSLLAVTPWLAPRSPVVRRLIVVLFAVLTIRYCIFRATETLPPLGLEPISAVVYLYWGLELCIAYFAWQSVKGLVRRTDRTPEVEAGLGWYSAARPPLVDILIPTYNEPYALLEATILAALNQDYARFRVWVLDDGKRDALRSLCERLGVNYLRRAVNTHFKAGNLNHAVEELRRLDEPPEFLAIVDADFILRPEFVKRTLALMQAPRTAIVQTPQRFYNPDPFQRAFKAQASWPDDLRSFFELRLPSLDAHGAATCCGTSFLLRFDALVDVGGFPVESVSEDTLLSVKLASRGWSTLYLQEGLSFGLSPEGISELLTQRGRTWLGSTQNAIYRWRSFGRRLCLRPRLNALETLVRLFLLPAFRLLAPLVPIIFWFTGVALVPVTAQELASYVVPLWAVRLGISWMSEGATLPIVSDAVGLLLAPTQLSSFFRAARQPENQRFVVTPKGAQRSSSAVHWRNVTVLALIILGSLAGLAFHISSRPSDWYSEDFLAWNLFATGFFLLVATVALMPCLEAVQRRAAQRFSCNLAAIIRHDDAEIGCVVDDVSLQGAALSMDRESIAMDQVVNLELPGGLRIPCKAVRRASRRLVVEFAPSIAQKRALIAFIFGSRRYVPEPTSWSLWGCGVAFARRYVPVARWRT